MSEGPSWMTPLLVIVVAFCAGVQLALLFQMLLGAWTTDALPMQLATLAVAVAGGYMLMSPERRAEASAWLQAKRAALPAPAAKPPPPPEAAPPPTPPRARPEVSLRIGAPPGQPLPPAPARAATMPPAAARAAPPPHQPLAPPPKPELAPVKMNLESPLVRGPVWPPGEPIPLTIQVKPAGPGDMGDVDVELELKHARGTERVRVPLKGNVAVLSQAVPSPGPFVLTARALRDGQTVSEASIEGYAASYREEIGRRFEALKKACERAGLEVGDDSTPREVREALAHRFPQMRPQLAELVLALEIALYSEEEVGRDTYESLVRALAELERRGLEAVAHG